MELGKTRASVDGVGVSESCWPIGAYRVHPRWSGSVDGRLH